MAINLGFVPVPITVALPTDGDFVATLQSSSAWPSGASVSLKFIGSSTTTWTATLSGNNMQFNKTASQVNTLLATDQKSVELLYTDSTGVNLVWGRGSVRAV